MQYDRHRYGGALERLVSVLEGLESADYRIAVVDNANEGTWFHQVSRRLLHVGGDNSSWEFSAFDRGLSCLDALEISSDVYIFATDAFLAYGDDYLELIDDHALQQCLDLTACAGWTDSFMRECSLLENVYDCWLRTSFLLVPAEILPRIRPLNQSLDPQLFFGPDPRTPFLPAAPVDETLQSLVLGWLTTHPGGLRREQSWHSRFELRDDTLERFQQKTLAIFREHLLSVRLRATGTPCYDFRLLRLLATNGTKRRRFAERAAEWQWLGWRSDPVFREPQYYLDACEIPLEVGHEDEVFVLVAGWVLSEPQAREVRLELSDGQVFPAKCDLLRPEVLDHYPEFEDEVCGFELQASLRLPAGDYGVKLSIPAASLDLELGTIHVRPKLAFKPLRQFFATSVSPGARFPVCLEGAVESTDELRAVEALLDGEPIPEDLHVDFALSRRPQSGIHRYSVSLFGRLKTSARERHHVLELRFETETGQTESWSRRFLVEKRDTAPHSLTRRVIGSYDPISATTRVELEGGYWNAMPEDRVVLLRDGEHLLAAAPALFTGSRNGETRAASFQVATRVGGLPPGAWDFDLAIDRQGQRIGLTSWREIVSSFAPSVHVEELDVEPDWAVADSYILRIVGHVTNTFLIDALSLTLDGQACAIAGVDQLQPTLKQLPEDGTVILQGFRIETRIEAGAGEHHLRIEVTQSGGQPAEWRRRVVFEPREPVSFRLTSADLAALESRRDRVVLPPVTIAGTVTSELTEIVAHLYGDGELADQCRVESGDEFCLRWIPPSPGRHQIRVDVRSRGRSLYDSGEKVVETGEVTIPHDLQGLLVTTIELLGLESLLLIDVEELTLRLVKKELARLPEFTLVLRRLNRRLQERATEAPRILDMDHLPPRPLRILFVAWEVPSARHGGGVCMLNLLKRLSKRHRVTLIHSYGLDETTWNEEARPFVDRLISIPRDYQATKYVTDPGIPDVYCHNYTPELRAAIQRELLAEDYDLVNYEYSTVFPHIVSPASVPSVLSILEIPTSAKRTTYFKDPSIETHVDQLRDFIKLAYFLADVVPRELDHLITLTESDASALLELGPQADVYINKIGIDCGFLAPPDDREQTAGDEPTLVFLGNYRHPPNTEAAEHFSTRVMPLVLERYPDARFLVLGGHAPEALRALDGCNNTEVLGFVDDFRPYLWDATAFVAPLTSGAGMRVKVLEAFACGAAIVATPLAVAGTEAVASRHYLRAETTGEMVEACCRLIRDQELREGLGEQGLALARSKHDWSLRANEREAIWQRIIESHDSSRMRAARRAVEVKT